MSRLSLRRYDVQASIGLALSVLALMAAGIATCAVWSRYHPEMRAIPYSNKSWMLPGTLGCVSASLLLSATGIALGISSAGQRRNDHQGRSWMAFFLGLLALLLGSLCGYAFWTLKIVAA